MKLYFSLIPLLLLFFGLNACQNKEDEMRLADMEQLLPGDWRIDSMRVHPNPTIDYFGKILEQDTTLAEVGRISIPAFEIANLDLNADFPEVVEADLLIEGVPLPFIIEQLFLSGDEYFVYFRQVDPTNFFTPEGIFIDNSQLFHKNHFIDVVSQDQLIIRQASASMIGRIYLSRE
jgi:hypothetical protein